MKTINFTKAAFLSLSLVVIAIVTGNAQEQKQVKKAVIKTVEINNGDTSIVMKEFNPDDPADKAELDRMMKEHSDKGGQQKQITVKVTDDGTGKKIEKMVIGPDGKEIKMDGNNNIQEEDIIMPDGKKGKKITIVSTSKEGDDKINIEERQMKFITDEGKEIQIEIPDGKDGKHTDGTVKVITHKDGADNEEVFAFKAKDGSKPIIIRIKDVKSTPKSANKTTDVSADKLVIDAMKVYPNPNTGKFNIGFTLTQKGTTQISVSDITGKEVFAETLKDFTGAYQKELDLTENVNGTYFISVTQNGKRTVKQIVKE